MTLKVPLNRVVTFVKPYINVAAGAAAAWVIAKANVLGIPGLGSHQNELATGLAAAGTGLLTWGAAQLGDLKWLKGHHIELEAVTQGLLAPDVHAAGEETTDIATDEVLSRDLPTDGEEFDNPPPDTPLQPSQTGLTDPV